MPTRKPDYSSWSQSEKKEFLRANRIHGNYQSSKDNFSREPYLILIFGLIVFALSSEKVNQNTVFSYFTFVQGLTLIPFCFLVKRTQNYKHLMYMLLAYVIIWLVEIIFFGFPNELLAAYNTVKIGGGNYMKPSVEFVYREENQSRDVYPLFPFIYSGVKLYFAAVIFVTFRNYYRWEKLPESMRERMS